MKQELEELIGKLKTYGPQMDRERKENFAHIFSWMAKYIEHVYSSANHDKSAAEMWVPLEASLNISIQLLKDIDRGHKGLDDQLADELQKIKERYLGK